MIIILYNLLYLHTQLNDKDMTTSNQYQLRTEWRNLNLKLDQIYRSLNINTKSGYIPTEEYLNWVNELKVRRDYLTTIVD